MNWIIRRSDGRYLDVTPFSIFWTRERNCATRYPDHEKEHAQNVARALSTCDGGDCVVEQFEEQAVTP